MVCMVLVQVMQSDSLCLLWGPSAKAVVQMFSDGVVSMFTDSIEFIWFFR